MRTTFVSCPLHTGYFPITYQQDCGGSTDMASSEVTFIAVKEQVSCDLAGETVILRLKNATYFGLDEVGSRIWNAIQQPRSVEQIVEVIMADYDVERARCVAEVRRLLSELCEHNLAEQQTDGHECSVGEPRPR